MKTPGADPIAFTFRRLRSHCFFAAAPTAAAAVLIGWLALTHDKSPWDVWLFLLLLGVGAAMFTGLGLALGRSSVVVSEAGIELRRPLGLSVSIAWADVGEVIRFERDKATDIVAAAGKPKLTIHDNIDRFAELQPVLVRRAGERYRTVASRPATLRPRTVAAILAVLIGGLFAWDWLSDGRVRVTVVDADGAPVAGASVAMFNKRYPQRSEKLGAAGFVERKVPAAVYSVSVSSPQHKTRHVKVEVRSLATEEVRVMLERRAP